MSVSSEFMIWKDNLTVLAGWTGEEGVWSKAVLSGNLRQRDKQ